MKNMSDGGGGAARVLPASDAEVWGSFLADLDALVGSPDVFQRRRAVVLRLLARGLPLSGLETVLPGWTVYLRPMGPTGE